jgi:hypothetical protein
VQHGSPARTSCTCSRRKSRRRTALTCKGKAGQLAESPTKLDLVILGELDYLPFSGSGGALLFHLQSKL